MTDIVVSSSGRKLGKTLLCCSMIRLLRETGHEVSFVKLARGTHCAPGLHDGAGRVDSDTHRAHSAGAAAVSLFRYVDIDELRAELPAIAPSSPAVIWESSSILELIEPDLHVHLADGRGAHGQSGKREPDLVVNGPVSGDTAERASRLGLLKLYPDIRSPFTLSGRHWIDLDDSPLLGEGRVELLRAIDRSGSILGAAASTGIPYKRAWQLIRGAEERLGIRLVASGRGGSGGGGSRLTCFARRMLELWESSETQFREMLKRLET